MPTVKIYRKGNRPIKVNRQTIDRVNRELSLRAKVRRPGIEALFIPAKAGTKSDFYKLPEVSPAIVKNRATRILDYSDQGYIVDMADLGRGNIADQSTANSIAIWIKSNLKAVVDIADVAVVVEDD